MTINEHIDKATMILDNTHHLYDRQQAIFKVYMLTGEDEDFDRQLIDLAKHVVIQTNLSETADPFMHGEVFDLVKAAVYTYMLREYYSEFVNWHEVKDGKVINKAG